MIFNKIFDCWIILFQPIRLNFFVSRSLHKMSSFEFYFEWEELNQIIRGRRKDPSIFFKGETKWHAKEDLATFRKVGSHKKDILLWKWWEIKLLEQSPNYQKKVIQILALRVSLSTTFRPRKLQSIFGGYSSLFLGLKPYVVTKFF